MYHICGKSQLYVCYMYAYCTQFCTMHLFIFRICCYITISIKYDKHSNCILGYKATGIRTCSVHCYNCRIRKQLRCSESLMLCTVTTKRFNT